MLKIENKRLDKAKQKIRKPCYSKFFIVFSILTAQMQLPSIEFRRVYIYPKISTYEKNDGFFRSF